MEGGHRKSSYVGMWHPCSSSCPTQPVSFKHVASENDQLHAARSTFSFHLRGAAASACTPPHLLWAAPSLHHRPAKRVCAPAGQASLTCRALRMVWLWGSRMHLAPLPPAALAGLTRQAAASHESCRESRADVRQLGRGQLGGLSPVFQHPLLLGILIQPPLQDRHLQSSKSAACMP